MPDSTLVKSLRRDRKGINVWVDPQLYEQITRVADGLDASKSEIMRASFQMSLPALKKQIQRRKTAAGEGRGRIVSKEILS